MSSGRSPAACSAGHLLFASTHWLDARAGGKPGLGAADGDDPVALLRENCGQELAHVPRCARSVGNSRQSRAGRFVNLERP
jgi:hypothetical protein